MTDLLRVENLTKVYPGGTVANYKINFSVKEGEIHALVGENGAGKSTLMKCLFGIEEITEGKVYYAGQEVHFKSGNDAIKAGIGMVQQNMMLVPSLTVAQNLVLNVEPNHYGLLDEQAAIKKTEEISQKFNLKVDAKKYVRDISVGMKQKLEILKTMYRGAKLIILDEPTAVLTPQETKELFDQLLELKKQNYTFIFISHKLPEVKYLCDRLTVLKDGRTVGTYNTKEVSAEEISKLMVGRDVKLEYGQREKQGFEPVMSVEHLVWNDDFGTPKVKDVSFHLRKGEVLGIAGIEGNGQKETMDIITGLAKPISGKVMIHDQDLTKESIVQIRKHGVAHVPEDRNLDGCVLDHSVRNNLIATRLSNFVKKHLLHRKSIDDFANQAVKDFEVVTSSLDTPIKSLSGGNIQKVIVAREFTANADIIVLNQPTRGIDVGAMESIHHKILEMRAQNKSLILISADLPELRALSDRILVFRDGRISGVLDQMEEVSDELIGQYMLGIKTDEEEKLKEA